MSNPTPLSQKDVLARRVRGRSRPGRRRRPPGGGVGDHADVDLGRLAAARVLQRWTAGSAAPAAASPGRRGRSAGRRLATSFVGLGLHVDDRPSWPRSSTSRRTCVRPICENVSRLSTRRRIVELGGDSSMLVAASRSEKPTMCRNVAQVVRDRVAERLELAVAPLEFRVDLAEFLGLAARSRRSRCALGGPGGLGQGGTGRARPPSTGRSAPRVDHAADDRRLVRVAAPVDGAHDLGAEPEQEVAVHARDRDRQHAARPVLERVGRRSRAGRRLLPPRGEPLGVGLGLHVRVQRPSL